MRATFMHHAIFLAASSLPQNVILRWGNGCRRNSLRLAQEHDTKTIAFPAISCGVYGYPLEAAAKVRNTFHEHFCHLLLGSMCFLL